MTVFPRIITGYWQDQFPVAPRSADVVGLAIRPEAEDGFRVTILELCDLEVRAVVTPEIADRLDTPPDEGWSPDQFKARLADIGVRLHGADLVFYFPQSANAQLMDVAPDAAIRQLTQDDAALFETFEADACEEDNDGASVGLDDWIVLGAFDDDRLVAAASMYQWDEAPLADVGVLTLPDARRKGHAAKLIRACATRALAEGFRLQYRCQFDNAASAALASSLGLELFGKWTAETPDA